MSNHTPGPWFAEKHLNHQTGKYLISIQTQKHFDEMLDEDDDPTIAGIHSTDKIDWHNANLIAAAPDLLEALEAVLSVADRATDEFDLARKAIAKARAK